MLRAAVIFLAIALVSAWVGFTNSATSAALIARVLFAVSVMGFLISLSVGIAWGRKITGKL